VIQVENILMQRNQKNDDINYPIKMSNYSFAALTYRLRTTGLESDTARNNIHPNNKQKPEFRNKNTKKIAFRYMASLSLT